MDPNTLLIEIMTPTPITLDSKSTLADVSGVFETNSFHHIPIVDDGKLVGIVSRKDYLRISHALSVDWSGRVAQGDKFADFLVRDIMTETPVSLAPDDTVGLAADIFLSNKFHSVPIVDDDTLVGIVTAHDIIAFAFKSPIEDTIN